MAASITVEEQQGTYVCSPHPHNGYYAGDFTRTTVPVFRRSRSRTRLTKGAPTPYTHATSRSFAS
jgi:hypothetical protein